MKRVDFDYLLNHIPDRPRNAHKGTMGTLVSLCGSYGFSGAAVLSAKAALRTGVGLHYQLIPKCVYPIFASSVYESVCVPIGDKETFSPADNDTILKFLEKATAVLIGCGMGNNDSTLSVLKTVVKNAKVPVTIDADGINALSRHIDILEEADEPIILTPHIKEFSRLSGLDIAEIIRDPAKAAMDFSLQYPKTVLALKSHTTYIASKGDIYENTAGNCGMAKGGSGDVLAGIISSLSAQGADPFESAVMGVHIHALAGDSAAEKLSKTAMLPSDIIDALPEIFSKLERGKEKAIL